MSRHPLSKEDLELNQIRATELLLLKREKESVANQQRLAQERRDREGTMPPLDDIGDRARRKLHELSISRGEVENIRRTQNYSIWLLLLLVVATCTLVWWGMRIMQGG